LRDNCIEEFLGPEVCANDIVLKSKLNADEKAYFEQEISIQELDKAVMELSLKSAGGSDGISTKFIRMFWHMLRVPFHRYTAL
jgi:hypothetical protein